MGDRRVHERLPFELEVELRTDGAAVRGQTADISEGGLLVRLSEPRQFPIGISMTTRLTGIGHCRVRVVNQSALGLHLAFDNLEEVTRARLEEKLTSIRSDNTEFIERAIATANHIARLFEEAVTQRRISIDDLFDNDYVRIPDTAPEQYTTRFLKRTEELLPPIQEPLLASDKRHGVLRRRRPQRLSAGPQHHLFKPQRRGEPVWNAANSRNRRIFDDRAGLSAGRVVRPYLIQNYPRDMGDRVVMMWKSARRFASSASSGGGFHAAYTL